MKTVKRAWKRKLRSALKTAVILIVSGAALMVVRWFLLSVYGDKPVCLVCTFPHVVHDYYAATGIKRSTLGGSPEKVMKIYGEPERIDEVDMGDGKVSQRYIYDGFGIIFSSFDPDEQEAEECKGVGFVLLSPDIKIRRDVHVGATRKDIIFAYRKCSGVIYPQAYYNKSADKVYDNGVRYWENTLYFTYDENNIVTEIAYYPDGRS